MAQCGGPGERDEEKGRANTWWKGREKKRKHLNERAKRTGSAIDREKYIDIRCMRALRRNRFLSKCKFEYALDNANR